MVLHTQQGGCVMWVRVFIVLVRHGADTSSVDGGASVGVQHLAADVRGVDIGGQEHIAGRNLLRLAGATHRAVLLHATARDQTTPDSSDHWGMLGCTYLTEGLDALRLE